MAQNPDPRHSLKSGPCFLLLALGTHTSLVYRHKAEAARERRKEGKARGRARGRCLFSVPASCLPQQHGLFLSGSLLVLGSPGASAIRRHFYLRGRKHS